MKKSRQREPSVLGFLRFLESQLLARPDQIVAADPKQLARIRKMVKGVKID